MGHLPETAQWVLYQRVLEVWHSGTIPASWKDTRISLLYKKGDPGDAANYRPIAVSTCMYQTLCNLMLLCLKSPLTSLLSSYQGGGRKGHTTITQATALWSNVLQFNGEPYAVLLDIAKAYPSTPHPLFWETMYWVGVPHPPLRVYFFRCLFVHACPGRWALTNCRRRHLPVP